MKRWLLLLTILILFAGSWAMFATIPLHVIGQPTSTGVLQQVMEEPFFAGLAEATGLPFKATYQPVNAIGLKDTHQLQQLQEGRFDLVSLRFIQNSEAEPSLQGIDLVGLISDYDTARRVVDHYADTVDRYLRETFDAKLLGVWAFGPQMIYCRGPIQGIADLAGLKVRVASTSMATLIAALGGTPAIIAFDDTRNALAIGLVDCAITSVASARFAGWLDYSRYYYPLAVHFGLNGYAISLKKWRQLSAKEQEILQGTFDAYLDDLWRFSEETHQDAANCIIGRPCGNGAPYQLTLVEPSPEDARIFKETARAQVQPEWAAKCEQVHPGCRQEWEAKVFTQVP